MGENRTNRAARILLALGPEKAAQILRHLNPEEIDKITKAIARVEDFSQSEADTILQEFENDLRHERSSLRGGIDKAKNLLVQTLGEDKAKDYVEKLERSNIKAEFRMFEDYSPEVIAQALSSESAQIVAVILTQFSPAFSARILSLLEKKTEIARRIARMEPVLPEVLERSYETLARRLENIEAEEQFHESDGEKKIAEILSYLDSAAEDNILSALRTEDGEMVERIKEKLFTFEDLLGLTKNEIRRLVERIPENDLWARALKGAGNDLTRHILSSLSINRASDIMDFNKSLSPLPLREVEDARRTIMKAAEELQHTGELYLRKDRDEMVE